jgi:predicted MFS family arabinose efflux permease
MTFLAGRVQAFAAFGLILFFSGMAWISIVACLNIAAQTMSPSWLRARALSMYILVLQGGMAIGSALWGALATRIGVPNTLLCSATALAAGLITARRYQLTSREAGFGASTMRDTSPMVQSEL